MAKHITSRDKIRRRVRKKVSGTAERPRLSVFRSNGEIYAQVINDETNHTLVSASSLKKTELTGKKSDKAKQVGLAVAKQCADAGITQVVFDRGGYLYHGRVKALAEGAREGGLKF